MRKISCLIFYLVIILDHGSASAGEREELEIHSFAHPDDVIVRHIDLNLTVDFRRKVLAGSALLHLEHRKGVNTLVLDTRDLLIHTVTLGAGNDTADFALGSEQPFMGRPLTIRISPETQDVKVWYETSSGAPALQWLDSAQTASGKFPYLYTQSQAILARSWVPCQDAPLVRFTYTARITVPPGMMALMSATNDTVNHPDGVYEFSMKNPIPSYLLALAVGDIQFQSISNRTGVYAEPSTVAAAAWEFADAEKMMQAAEKLYGPYRWGRYDILVLPPSFPFGGMENPRLTFVTPTLIAGDRSLVSTIAHEMAHSWSGNLVTNASWEDFWLNEGFTTYFERRIDEEVYGKDFADMEGVLGFQNLMQGITEIGPDSSDTQLHLDLKRRDPDDAGSDIPYEKGYLFLRLLENTVGRERWDSFLRTYFETYAFKSMTSSRFVVYLRQHLIKGNRSLEDSLQIDDWVFGKGLPANSPHVQSTALEQVEKEIAAWKSGTPAKELKTKGWVSQQWEYFLRKLPEQLTFEQMAELDNAFNLTQSINAQVSRSWLVHVIDARYKPAYEKLRSYLVRVGRRWLIRPLYLKLARFPEGMVMAKDIYTKARPGYHTLTQETIDEILGWNPGTQ